MSHPQDSGEAGQQPQGASPGAKSRGGARKEPTVKQTVWLAVALVVVIALWVAVWLFHAAGAAYVGATMPDLPDEFGSWKRQGSLVPGLPFNVIYENGDRTVGLTAFPFDPAEKADPSELLGRRGSDVGKVGPGIYCPEDTADTSQATCSALWEDGGIIVLSNSAATSESAIKDFVRATR